MKSILKTFTFLTIVFSLFFGKNATALAVEGLEIKHNGVLLSGDPIFTINNMLPGDSAVEVIEIKNLGPKPVYVGVKGIRTGDRGHPVLLIHRRYR